MVSGGADGGVDDVEAEGEVFGFDGGGEGFGCDGEGDGRGSFSRVGGVVADGVCVWLWDGLGGVELEGLGEGFGTAEQGLRVHVCGEDFGRDEDVWVAEDAVGEGGYSLCGVVSDGKG